MSLKNSMLIGALAIVALGLAGCGKSPNKEVAAATPADEAAAAPHDHDGWWCDEHGMPESVCAQCSAKLAADFKAKGDWCKEHDRPDSQCFICHPELQAKFAA